jgi:hypothetical protein
MWKAKAVCVYEREGEGEEKSKTVSTFSDLK